MRRSFFSHCSFMTTAVVCAFNGLCTLIFQDLKRLMKNKVLSICPDKFCMGQWMDVEGPCIYYDFPCGKTPHHACFELCPRASTSKLTCLLFQCVPMNSVSGIKISNIFPQICLIFRDDFNLYYQISVWCVERQEWQAENNDFNHHQHSKFHKSSNHHSTPNNHHPFFILVNHYSFDHF